VDDSKLVIPSFSAKRKRSGSLKMTYHYRTSSFRRKGVCKKAKAGFLTYLLLYRE